MNIFILHSILERAGSGCLNDWLLLNPTLYVECWMLLADSLIPSKIICSLTLRNNGAWLSRRFFKGYGDGILDDETMLDMLNSVSLSLEKNNSRSPFWYLTICWISWLFFCWGVEILWIQFSGNACSFHFMFFCAIILDLFRLVWKMMVSPLVPKIQHFLQRYSWPYIEFYILEHMALNVLPYLILKEEFSWLFAFKTFGLCNLTVSFGRH